MNMTQRVRALSWVSVLYFLFVSSLLISMSLMELMGGVLLLWFLVDCVRKPESWREAFPSGRLNAIYAFFLVVVAAGFLFKASHEAPWFKRIGEFKWYFYLAALYWFFIKNQIADFFQKSILWFLLVAALYGLGTFIFKMDLIDPSGIPESPFRVGGFFSNPMVYAQSLVLFVSVLWGIFLRDWKNKIQDRLFVVVLILTTLNVVLTFTRGVWIALFFSILIGAFLVNWKMGLKTLVAGLISLGLAFAFVSPVRERMLQAFDSKKSYDSERVVVWQTNLKIFFENPLLGIGYGENKRRLREYYDRYGVPAGQFEGHAHNQYLHFMAGTGVLGLVAYLLLNGFFLISSWQVYRCNESPSVKALSLGLLMAQVSFALAALTESNFEHARVKYALIFIWAMVMALRFPGKPKGLLNLK